MAESIVQNVPIVDATRKKTIQEAPTDTSLDARIEGEQIVLKPHVEIPKTSELALDLSESAPEEASVPVLAPETKPVSNPEPEIVLEVPPPSPPKSVQPESSFYLDYIHPTLHALLHIKKSKQTRIMAMANLEGSVTVEDVQSHFHISGASATRHLAQLVARGKLKRAGTHQSRYEPVDPDLPIDGM